jgi:hypothetical protein
VTPGITPNTPTTTTGASLGGAQGTSKQRSNSGCDYIIMCDATNDVSLFSSESKTSTHQEDRQMVSGHNW